MSDIPILPNPFKMLDLEREKKMKLMDDKCNSCDDDKKEGFNNLKKDKPIIEGMEQDEEGRWFAGVLSVVCVGVFIFIKMEWIPTDIIKNFDWEYFKTNKKTMFGVLLLCVFIAFAYISLFLHTKDDNIDDKWYRLDKWVQKKKGWIPIVVGAIMFMLRFVNLGTGDVPALIGYFENTVGHFWFLVFSLRNGGLNEWIRSDNFGALTDKNGGSVTNDYNPLMSRFNLNNYDADDNNIISQMRFSNDTNNTNKNESSDFFVTLNHEDGQKTKKGFTEYIKNQVILKRAWGEVTLLILTTLISTGILQSVYH